MCSFSCLVISKPQIKFGLIRMRQTWIENKLGTEVPLFFNHNFHCLFQKEFLRFEFIQ